jgi:hypothetical protein
MLTDHFRPDDTFADLADRIAEADRLADDDPTWTPAMAHVDAALDVAARWDARHEPTTLPTGDTLAGPTEADVVAALAVAAVAAADLEGRDVHDLLEKEANLQAQEALLLSDVLDFSDFDNVQEFIDFNTVDKDGDPVPDDQIATIRRWAVVRYAVGLIHGVR